MTPAQALLSMMLQDNDIFYKSTPQPWWFTDNKDKAVYNGIVSALENGTVADVLTVGEYAGMSYTSSLTSLVPTTANWSYYADECKKQGSREELGRLTHVLIDGVKHKEIVDILSDIDSYVDKIVSGSEEYKIQPVQELLGHIIPDLEERYKNRGKLPGLQTGFKRLDDITGGLQKERLYIIGARPSQGKSALALNMASLISQHYKVGFLSLESSWKEMLIRAISSESGINSQRLASGYFSHTDFSKLFTVADKIHKSNLFIYDKPNCSLVEVIGQARRMVRRFKCDVLFIDYLQLIEVQADNERDRVTKVSKRLKDMSRELGVPVVALAQLRRDSEGRRPSLGDFADSSQIEKDADVALIIYHQVFDKASGKVIHKAAVENEATEEKRIFLLVDKNRDGQTGAVPVEFIAENVKFLEKNT